MFRFLFRTTLVSFCFSILLVMTVAVYLQHNYKGNVSFSTERIHLNQDSGQDMVLHFINLKIGKTVLIQIGDEGVLMDVGDNEDHQDLMNYLKAQGISTISQIILTNWTMENTSGLSSLLNAFPDAQVYIPSLTADHYTLPSGFTYHEIQSGDHLTLSNRMAITLDILSPLSPLFNEAHNDSIVSVLHYQKLKVLLTSDIREAAEKKLLEKYPHLKAEIMTVPDRPTGVLHSKSFIKTINSQTAVMIEMPCDNCNQIIKDAANSYSQEWSDFFFVPIGKNLKINFNEGAYTTPKNQ